MPSVDSYGRRASALSSSLSVAHGPVYRSRRPVARQRERDERQPAGARRDDARELELLCRPGRCARARTDLCARGRNARRCEHRGRQRRILAAEAGRRSGRCGSDHRHRRATVFSWSASCPQALNIQDEQRKTRSTSGVLPVFGARRSVAPGVAWTAASHVYSPGSHWKARGHDSPSTALR